MEEGSFFLKLVFKGSQQIAFLGFSRDQVICEWVGGTQFMASFMDLFLDTF